MTDAGSSRAKLHYESSTWREVSRDAGGAMGMVRAVLCVAFAGYALAFAWELYGIFYPPRCRGKRCLRPLLSRGARVDITALVGAETVWSARNVTWDTLDLKDLKMTVPVPADVRRGLIDSIWLNLYLAPAARDVEGADPAATALASARVRVVETRARQARSEAVWLLERAADEPGTPPPPPPPTGPLPHLIYANRGIDLRLVADHTPHRTAHFADNLPIGNSVDVAARVYAPLFYAETFHLLRKHALPLDSNVSRADPTVRRQPQPQE